MRSPICGFSGGFPFRAGAAGGAADAYLTNGFSPDLVLDFSEEYYRVGGSVSTHAAALTSARSGLATMVDSGGTLKWCPHNLALNSASPATQGITVVVGADYTVEITGSGSVALSGAGSGTVTAGNPVEITASTTTLTLTVTGSPTTMSCYRSDLGGMVNNPDTASSYVPTTGSARYLARRGNHIYSGGQWVNAGAQAETESRTNLLHTTGTLPTQNVTTTAQAYTLHFTGTGTVTLSGTSTAGPLVGTGAGENNRVSLTFTPSAGTLTLTVSGTVTNAQLEAGSTPSSYIPNVAASGTVTRSADTLTIAAANLPYSATAMSIVMRGTMTYADTGVNDEAVFVRWYASGANFQKTGVNTPSTKTGEVYFAQVQSSLGSTVLSDPGELTPGVNIPINWAVRLTDAEMNGAVAGTALTVNTTPTALPDLSATNLGLAYDFMGNVELFTMFDADIEDAGLEEATA